MGVAQILRGEVKESTRPIKLIGIHRKESKDRLLILMESQHDSRGGKGNGRSGCTISCAFCHSFKFFLDPKSLTVPDRPHYSLMTNLVIHPTTKPYISVNNTNWL